MNKQTFTKLEEIKRVIPLGRGRQMPLSRPLVMGVLNVTPDSFSDGGRYDSPDRALQQALAMVKEGADIIDVGGESSRPGAEPVSPEVERRRVVPVIEWLRAQSDVCISVDTYHAATAESALAAGADMINDISALRSDPEMARIAAETRAPVVLMHMQGTPRDMQLQPHYENCVEEILSFLRERIEQATAHGIDRSKIIVDPGIGFGKRLSDNLEILSHLREFKRLGLPITIGASRKSFIGQLSQTGAEPSCRLGGSIAAAVIAVNNGADIVRVHDVAPTVEALKVLQGISSAV